MKRKILIIFTVAILLLDWAALDDITTGNEPSLSEEYFIVIISVPILLIIGYLMYKNKQAKRKNFLDLISYNVQS